LLKEKLLGVKSEKSFIVASIEISSELA